MSKIKPEVIKAIVTEAFDAARKASAETYEKIGDRDACGFAWVKVHPARGAIVDEIKRQFPRARKWEGESGLSVWDPAGHPTQSVSVKEAGAEAFAAVLRKYGYKAYGYSRLD